MIKKKKRNKLPIALSRSNLSKIGVEIEGGWRDDDNREFQIGDDGSVHVCSYDNDDGIIDGEVRSDPFGSMKKLIKWVQMVYPHKTNETCGLHIHVSVPINRYALLMEDNFNTYFWQELRKWGERHCKNRKIDENQRFWERFEGRNEYCQPSFNPLGQISGEDTERYRALNFCAFYDHRTLECRLFPAFSSKTKALQAIIWFAKIVHKYLDGAKETPLTPNYIIELKKCIRNEDYY